MKPSRILTPILLCAAMTLALALSLPYVLRHLEGIDFIQLTAAHFAETVTRPGGLTGWVNEYLTQFFRWPVAGALTIAAVLTLAGPVLLGDLLRRFGAEGWTAVATLLPGALFLTAPYVLTAYLYVLGLVLLLWLINLGARPAVRLGALAVGTVAGFYLLPTALCCALPAVQWLLELRRGQNLRRTVLWHLPLVAAAALWPLLLTADHDYPIVERFDFSLLIYYTVIAAALLPLFLPAPKRIAGRLALGLELGAALLSAALCWTATTRENLRQAELHFKVEALAMQHDWEGVQQTVAASGLRNNTLLAYQLLAESELGTLPDHLMQYPLDGSGRFLFPHDFTPHHAKFNALFYSAIGLHDEALRQAFDLATAMMPYGLDLELLRMMARSAALGGDHALADRYLRVLGHTSCHAGFIRDVRGLMAERDAKKDTLALRDDNFTGVYPFNSEIIRQLERRPDDRKLLDYELCGLLLDRRVETFGVIFNDFYRDSTRTLPRLYAEAGVMLRRIGQPLRPAGREAQATLDSPELDTDFTRFYDAFQHRDVQTLDRFRQTYWYYHFCKP